MLTTFFPDTLLLKATHLFDLMILF